VQFAYQHNATWLGADEVSVFDDEGAPPVQPPSRGELIKLDTQARTATLAGQLVRSPGPLSTTSQGDVQALPGGNFMIGWGGLPNLSEFNAAGEVIFDAQLPAGENSYRVYREPWAAQPSEAPAIAARTNGSSSAVYASWNGATTVTAWQLLTGADPSHMTPVSSTPKSGFETTIPAPGAAYVQVRALSASGKILGSSKTIRPSGA
jgi:Arylsulfotransferase (ASST)